MAIVGLDEVGRGALAGPLLVCAVRYTSDIDGLRDSKKLTKIRRQKLTNKILELNQVGFGWVSNDEIDDLGLTGAMHHACARAMTELEFDEKNDEIIIDGNINYLPALSNVRVIIKADDSYSAVSAASIVAKTTRDARMAELDQQIGGYDWARNAGYGTAKHIASIKELGYSNLHRQTFRLKSESQTTKATGNLAETIASDYLKASGHQVIQRNWQTRFCEIDIISYKDGTVFFNEVKYRKNDSWGDGLEVITAKKLNQMKFAAKIWLANNGSNHNAILQVISLDGSPPRVKDILEIS